MLNVKLQVRKGARPRSIYPRFTSETSVALNLDLITVSLDSQPIRQSVSLQALLPPRRLDKKHPSPRLFCKTQVPSPFHPSAVETRRDCRTGSLPSDTSRSPSAQSL